MQLTDEWVQVDYDLYSKLGSRVLTRVRRSVPTEDYKTQSIILLRGLSFRDVLHRIYRLMFGCHDQSRKPFNSRLFLCSLVVLLISAYAYG